MRGRTTGPCVGLCALAVRSTYRRRRRRRRSSSSSRGAGAARTTTDAAAPVCACADRADRHGGIVGEPQRTVFVARLAPTTTQTTVTEAMSRYGRVVRARLVRDLVTGESRRYAFVEYERRRDAEAAVRLANGRRIDGRPVLVEPEVERRLPGWVPRRLGGGLGGRKESGQLRFGGRDRPFRMATPGRPPVGSPQLSDPRAAASAAYGSRSSEPR